MKFSSQLKIMTLTIALVTMFSMEAWAAAKKSDFNGEWHRTNVDKAYGATITITKQTDKFFEFIFEGIAGANTGDLESRAVFTGIDRAICDFTDEFDANETAKIEFFLKDSILEVQVIQGTEMALGFGAGVFISGEYTKGEPNYANADIVEKVLGTENIKKTKKLLGESAFAGLVAVMEDGIENEAGDLTYSGFINGAGMGVDLLIKGDKIYCLGYNIDENDPDFGYTFYTNDSAYAKKLPRFMAENLREDVSLKFVYMEL